MAGPSLLSSSRVRAWMLPLLALALGAIAYRALLLSALELPGISEFERWMFRPSRQPAPLVIALAIWLVWRRRERLSHLPPGRSLVGVALWLAAGIGLFVWALLTRSVDLLLPSLAANLLALASASRGGAGCRVVALPALVLLLGMRIPPPIEAEIVWQLQKASAVGAGWLLEAIGRDITRFGVMLRGQAHTFHVIDTCSGLAGIEILVLVSFIVRELFADAGRREWLLVLIAPPLAMALNVVRITYIAASPGAAAGDHSMQGVAVLAAGTAVLYALAVLLAAPSRDAKAPLSPPDVGVGIVGWPTIGWLGVLALLSFVVSPFSVDLDDLRLSPIAFPEQHAGWRSEPIEMNPDFSGPLPEGQRLYRRYTRRGASAGEGAVELFIASELASFPTSSRLLSSKLLQPGPDWEVDRTRAVRLWALDRDAALSVARRNEGSELAVVYTWRLRDQGLWRESWRSLLSLDWSPMRRDGRRLVVQLVSFAPFEGPLALDRAKQQLDRFVTAFKADLTAL